MKSLIYKSILFAVLLFASLKLLDLFLPAYWGNEVIYKKFRQLEKEKQQVNTLFIGTSRVHCHIDPIQFDKGTKTTKSYNVACPGASGLETLQIINEIIDDPNNKIKNIYVEVPMYNAPPSENKHSVRAVYFYGFNGFIHSIKNLWSKPQSFKERISASLNNVSLWLSTSLNLGMLATKLNIIHNLHLCKNDNQTHQKKGYSGLNRDAEEPGQVKNRLQFARKFYGTVKDSKDTEIPYLTQHLSKKVKEAKEAGINLVYILMPKIPINKYEDNYHSIIQLPNKNFMNLSNPKTHPEFYKLENSADKAHLNTKGAKLMTSYLSKHHQKHFNKKQG